MKAVILAVLACGASVPAFAETLICTDGLCAEVFTLQSVSETKSYGLLLEAPSGDCRRVRYSITSSSAEFLGHTPPLGPGEVAVVRMGRGFSEGDHDLIIDTEGCVGRPAVARRVTLSKASPDHGWRATGSPDAVRPSSPWLPTR